MMANNNNIQSIVPKVNASRLILISSGALLGNTIKHYLQGEGYCTLVQQPEQVRRCRCDLVLLDAGSYSRERCLAVFPLVDATPVALINTHETLASDLLKLHPHIRGVFYPGSNREQILRGTQAILGGGDWLPRNLMQQLVDCYRQLNHSSTAIASLSAREIQVLALAGRGLSNADIADQVNLSVHTIKSHIHHALQKLDASNRAQGAALVLGHIEGGSR
ncbi:helix-turn-helix transcriptional regulator [Pseudomonas profundi]|nr:response regulator transcription factor [Pseudomonas profundi]